MSNLHDLYYSNGAIFILHVFAYIEHNAYLCILIFATMIVFIAFKPVIIKLINVSWLFCRT